MLLWHAFGEQWELLHKVDFDGERKRIVVAPGVTELSVKIDLYSSWKEWVRLYDYSKYDQAFRVVGGDPVGGGLFAGDIYFLINGWQIEVGEALAVNGTLYHDDPISPYVILPGGGVIATVSNLSYSVSSDGAGSGSAPTAAEVATAVKSSLAPDFADVQTSIAGVPTAVWTQVLEGLTAEEMMRIMLAALSGKRQGLGTPTEEYMARDGVTPRITLAADAAGNGTPVVNGAP